MAGVFSTQQRVMEDTTMRNMCRIDAEETCMGTEEQYYDPMDISPLPSNEQSRHNAQPMDGTSDRNVSRPEYWVHFTPPKSGGVPKATRLEGKPATRAPIIRPLTRFSPQARINPSTGRFKQQFIAQPFLRNAFATNNIIGHLNNETNAFTSTNRFSSHSNNIFKSLPHKPVTIGTSVPTTRDSSFNSLLTTKSIWDRKTPSFESNTSITTATSFNSRKRSVDDGFNEPTYRATPETDSPSNKYRRVSEEGFPNSAITSQEDTRRAEAPSTHATHPTQEQPTVPTATFPVRRDTSTQFQTLTAPIAFAAESHLSTCLNVTDQTGHPRRTDVLIPGGWPEQPSHDNVSATATPNAASVNDVLRLGEEPLMTGALDAPSPTTSLPDPSGSNTAAADESENADDQRMQAIDTPDNDLYNRQISHMLRPYWATCYTIVQGAYAASGTVKNVLTKTWNMIGQPVIDYVRCRRRPQPSSRSPGLRASPSRVAALRRLPEEQKRMIRDYERRRQRGYPTVQNLPFPDLTLDIPQYPTTGSSSFMEMPNDFYFMSHAANSVRNPQKGGSRSPESIGSHWVNSGIKKPTGVQKSPQVKSMSPNLKRRLWPGRNLERGKRELALQKAWKTGDFSGVLKDQRPPVSTHIGLSERTERLGEPAPEEGPKPKQKKRVRFKDPIEQFIPEPTLPDLAPYLHPTSPNIDRVSLRKASNEQKENVPPVFSSAIKTETKDEQVGLGGHWWEEQIEHPLGRPVSAVRLFYPEAKPLPPGRTESVYAEEWRKIEEEEERKRIPARIRVEGPAVRPLSGEWMSRVSSAMATSSNRRIATTLAGDPLTKKDLSTCFTPMAWLNDEVINSYLALIVDYLRRTNHNNGRGDKPRFHAFNTFFFSNMRDKGYQSVRRWANRAKIGGASLLDVDTVFVPVHNSAHWTLIVIKPLERTIEHFDSLGSVSHRHVGVMKDWLRNELGPRYAEEEWRVLPSVSPQQDNGSDCGVFLLSTAKAVAIGIEPLSYCARDIVLLRKKIVAELMAGGLEGDFDPASGGEVLL
ncbi:sentrin/sumo-specific protease [Aspergillus bombycis]|uniref:Sentrin/sumo-specific protease n=1 Tax=Aspergillus bombycis TaxID=109264 RepID=A0A1F7ZKM3_9EURO|nr:sentrin/sumo-specific protease [Aspergillus bombycis]OGM39859.1 sentrin/sumo-specific protease [Aspergillus bombycis]